MVKKLNLIAATIKTLLQNNVRPINIARKLKISKQRVNYWIKTPIKSIQSRRKKLDKKYIDKIISLGENQTTSAMSSRKIANIMNSEFKANDINLSVSKDTVNRYLKETFGKPRKIRKVFHLTGKQKAQRVKFCKDILKRMIDGKNILFTDETQIKTGAFVKDSIRLSQENQRKLKEGVIEAYDLINRPEKKFEDSIMVAGGISSGGLTNLILVENTVNEFAYAQMLLYFKEDYEKIKEKIGELYFEQDGATSHTSVSNKKLIHKLFGDNILQNAPNSPDLAYPIENIWGYIKPRIKARNPKNIEELKRYAVEEWNKIPSKIIKKCGSNYIKRIKKIIEIKGERLEQYHLNQIKREEANEEQVEMDVEEILEKEEGEENIKKTKKKNQPKEILKMKIAYNDKRLNILKKKEIANLRKRAKNIKEKYRIDNQESKKYKAKDLKLMSISRADSIIEWKKNLKPNKDKKIEEINKKINDIEKMDLIAYLRYSKEKYQETKIKKEKNKENCENDEESTIDEIDEAINKILKINTIEEEEGIKYELEFV